MSWKNENILKSFNYLKYYGNEKIVTNLREKMKLSVSGKRNGGLRINAFNLIERR